MTVVEEVHGPHIPALQGEMIPGWNFSLFGMDFGISNTVFSTWIFIVLLFIVLFLFKKALDKDSSVLKGIGVSIVNMLYGFSNDFVGDKKFSEKLLFLTGGLFVFIFFANVYGLLIDWILLIVSPDLHLSNYLRPINSDPNTTFGLSISVVLISHFVMIKSKGFFHYVKGYLFNATGKGFEKAVNVFLGWLHFISELVKMLSLSLRLFGNIFAGIILIGILAFLGGFISLPGMSIGEVAVLPFWFFELFVAFIQAVVFFVLSSIYFKQATELEH